MRYMRLNLFALLIVLLPMAVQAQTGNFRVLLRTMQTNIPTKQSSKACVIVQDNGQYRYEELPSFQKITPQNSKVYTGVLPEELRKQLDALVDKKDLRDLGTVRPAHWGMRAQNNMELISLRLRRGGAADQELNYFVADGKGIIPPPVEAFKPWMNSLKRKLGAPLKDAQPDTCKVAGDTPSAAH